MRLLVVILLALIASVAVALWAMEDPGYVLVAVAGWSVETTLTLMVMVLLAVFAAFYFMLRMGSKLRAMPSTVRHWRRHRQQGRARAALTRGLIELAEGRWPAAERHLLRYASKSQTPLLIYLAAARAAQAQGADERRDQYLKLAHQSHPSADIAVGLTQAELQLNQQQLEQALATLRHLQQLAPKHTHVLKALARLYRQLGDWEHLLELLPTLRRRKVLEVDELDELTRQACIALLQASSGAASENLWSRISREFQEDRQVLLAYVKKLLETGNADVAEPLLRKSLKQAYDAELVRLYGLIEGVQPARQLATLEALLENNKNDASMLLAAGRQSLRNQLWGKARSYLEASINIRPLAESYNELGNLLEQLGEREAAAECFHAGLRLVPGCEYPVASAIPAAKESTERLPAG